MEGFKVILLTLLGGMVLFLPRLAQAVIAVTPPEYFVGDGAQDSGTSSLIEINIIDEEPGIYYLKAYFYPLDNARLRFGYVWNTTTEQWVSTWQENAKQLQIEITKNGSWNGIPVKGLWQGQISVKTDIEKTGYHGPGNYGLKVRASSVSTNDQIEISMEVSIVKAVSQLPVPAETPSEAPPLTESPQDNQDETDATEQQTTATIQPQIIINELLPNPQGKDTEGEFIELKNLSDLEINLAGWQIKDKSGKTYTFNQEKIPAQGFLVLAYSQSKITLNNTGSETLFLSDANGKIIDSITYENCPEGQSYNLFNEAWQWSETPTPGTENIITSQKTTEQDAQETAGKTEEDKQDETPAIESSSESAYKKYSNNIYINEFIPDPTGSDQDNEWIELYNDDIETIDLTNWQLDDAEDGSAAFIFEETILMSPGQYLVLSRSQTKIALNNTEDQVRLFYPNGDLAQEVSYFDSQEAWSVARQSNGQYAWTNQPTPNAENIISQKSPAKQTSQPKITVATSLTQTYQAPPAPTPKESTPVIKESSNVVSGTTTENQVLTSVPENPATPTNPELTASINKNKTRTARSTTIGKTIALALLVAGAGAIILLNIKRRLR